MKFKLKLALLPVLTLIASTQAYAGAIELEPYAGYGLSGKMTTTAVGGGDGTTSFSNIGAGARLNLKLFNFLFLGPDFSYQMGSSGTYSITDASLGALSGNLTKGSLMTVGGVLGFQLPLGIRIWGGYNFMDTNSGTGSISTTVLGQDVSGTFTNKYSGTTIKVGAGFKLFSVLRLNAEYYMQTYTKVTSSSDITIGSTTTNNPETTTDLSGSDVVKSNVIFLSLSAPLGG